MEIKPLSKKNLNYAIKLAKKVFPYSKKTDEDYAPKWFKASLEPKKYRKDFIKNDIKTLKYFVAINDKKKVIGIVGIYTLNYDKNEANWLGWYCVDSEFRGKGIGRLLLKFIITKTKKDKKKWLRLYTSTQPNEKRANKIYDTLGFKPIKDKKIQSLIKSEKFKEFTKGILYKELKINY